MGYEDRDYFQEDRSQTSTWAHDTPTTKWLIIVTVVVFLFQTVLTREAGVDSVIRFGARRISLIDEWFMLDADATLGGQIWRVLTYTFCHNRQSPFGLVFNVLGIWFFGARLERMYGSRELLFFYLGSALTAGILFTAFATSVALPIPLESATPAVLALFTLYATHFPRQQILFAWVIPIEIWVLLLIYAGLDAYSLLQAIQGEVGWHVAAYTAAHFSGIAFGYCYRQMNWHLSGGLDRVNPSLWRKSMRQAKAHKNLRLFSPESETETLDEKVDAILAKIHEQGTESLTDAERKILTRASEKLKNRPRA
jgi:membrane associated rhomboid family serine protease